MDTSNTIEMKSDQQQDKKDLFDKGYRRQLLAALAINSSSFLQGASISTSSIILHQLQQNEINVTISQQALTDNNFDLFENFQISEETGSWIGIIWH